MQLTAKNLLSLAVAIALLAGAAGRSYSHSLRSVIGVRSAQGATQHQGAASDALSYLGSTAAVVAKLQAMAPSFQSESGLTSTEISSTQPISTLNNPAAASLNGLSAYETNLANGGFCLTFAAPTACSQTGATLQDPIVGLSFDPDSETSGQPFVAVGIRQPSVTAVTYSCGGASYEGEISGSVVWFVGPANLSFEDCTQEVAFADGHTLTTAL